MQFGRGLLKTLIVMLPTLVACGGSPEDGGSDGAEALSAAPVLGADPAGNPARLPIILVQGFSGNADNVWAFNGVKAALEADGHHVVEARTPAFDSSEVRAAALEKIVDDTLKTFGATKVHLIAHSQGGLDSRVLASPAGLARGDQIASITTISTPHHGTFLGDVGLELVPTDDGTVAAGFDIVLAKTLDAFFGGGLSKPEAGAHLHAAFASLAESGADAFNAKYVNAPGVTYLSWAGSGSILGIPSASDSEACQGPQNEVTASAVHGFRMSARAALLEPIISHGKPNDGIATVESSHWGEFQGCIPGDHLSEVGQPGLQGPDPRTGIDHVRFYRNVAFDLSRREE